MDFVSLKVVKLSFSIAGRTVSICGLSGPQLSPAQPADAKRSYTAGITAFLLKQKDKNDGGNDNLDYTTESTGSHRVFFSLFYFRQKDIRLKTMHRSRICSFVLISEKTVILCGGTATILLIK